MEITKSKNIEITKKIAKFIKKTEFEQIPKRCIPLIVDPITDSIGVAYAAMNEELTKILFSTIHHAEENEAFKSFLFGTKNKASLTDSALFNGSVIHALDYDDTNHPAYAHPSSHLVPVIIALGQQYGASGKDMITAYAIGIEMLGKLGRVMNMDHYGRGWHATSTMGTIAAVSAGAKLMDLSIDEISTALAIGASMASGIRCNFGTMTKPFHAGLAARNGVLACTLAKQGFTGNKNVFETKHGFLQVFTTETPDISHFENLGAPFEIETEYSICVKPYPSCGATHPSIEAAITLAEENDIQPQMVKDVRVGVNDIAPNILIYDHPTEPLQGKFSMQYCIAAAITYRKVNLATFSEEIVDSSEMQRLIKNVTMEIDERVIDNPEFGAIISIRLYDGRKLEKQVDLAKGKPEKWLSQEELYEKFSECLRFGGYDDDSYIKQLFAGWQALEEEENINNLLNMMK
jgi:2-methylcitrate dehydratase PrpD